MLRCVCLNDKNMPPDFKQKELWVKENVEYRIERIVFVPHSMTIGVELAEIDLFNNAPYTYFKLSRFGIYDIDAFIALLNACNEEQQANFDVNKYVEKLLDKPKVKELELVELD